MRSIKKWRVPVLALGFLVVAALVGCGGGGTSDDADRAPETTVAGDSRTVFKDAFVYGYPMIETYKVLWAQSLDPGGAGFKAPLNVLKSEARVFGPDDRTVVTPNSDTPYSFIWLDLRAEPMVLTVPSVEKGRYFSIQLIDLYTHNFAYIGTRATGNGGGDFLIAGPDWDGDKPEGVEKIIPCETQFALGIYRTQLFSPEDIGNVEKIQAGYGAQPLSVFAGTAPPPPPPAIDWPAPREGMAETPVLFEYLNFLLAFCPPHPSEKELMARFATVGIGPGLVFDAAALDDETRAAAEGGIADAWEDFEALKVRMDRGEVTSEDAFGTREFLRNNYLYRLAAANIGLYGNSAVEAMYPTYFSDTDGEPLDASAHRYTLRFAKGALPPAEAFWSVTLYDGRTQFLVDNPIDRYLVNSTMLDSFVRGDDGSITFYIGQESPGPDLEPNWIPAPDGPFYLVLRLYIPEPATLDGSWTAPPVRKAS